MMLDFLNAVPKLFLRLRLATQSAVHTSGKETASGYTHTFSDCRGIDLSALSAFPTDDEINHAAKEAYDEAENLIFILDVSPELLTGLQTKGPTRTPMANDHDLEEECNDEDDMDSGAAISHLYDCVENLGQSTLSSDRRDQIRDLSYASIMLSAHRDIEM